jgi:hypothetical protein
MVLNGYSKAVVYTLNKSLKAGISERKIKRSKHPPSTIKHKSMTRQEIITDEQLDYAWGYANFGDTSKRKVIEEALHKVVQGYDDGHTATYIVKELGLTDIKGREKSRVLTDLGLKYLLAPESLSPVQPVRGAEEILKEAEKIFKGMRDSPKDGAGLHYLQKTVFWEDLESFIKRYMSKFGYTLAQVSDAWDAGQRFEYADGECFDPNPYPDKQTFLNSLKPLK